MNAILKGILLTAETVAVKSIPGADAVDSGVRAVVAHNVPSGILDAAEGAIKVIEAFKEADIADETLFRAGVLDLESGVDKIKRALKSTSPTTTTTVTTTTSTT